MTGDRLHLITEIVQGCGAEVQAASAELSEATRREIRLRGALAMAMADKEAAQIRHRDAVAELARWWPEYRAVVTERAREVAGEAGQVTQEDLEMKA